MKKIRNLINIFILISLTSCTTPLERQKRKMIEICSNDENYITVTGEITEIIQRVNYLTKFIIKSDELMQYFSCEINEYEHLIHSSLNVSLEVGNVITYTTLIYFPDWLPIVAIWRNEEMILEFEDGKADLIASINKRGYK